MKILAVDDDQFVLRPLRTMLERAGYDNLRTCTSAEEALTLINNARRPFTCFILDIQMPGMDGVQLCRTIRENRQHAETPILMLTAMSEKSHVDRAFAAGATDYITKPLDATEIMARLGIAEALNRERKSLAESAGVIDSLIEVLDRSTRHDFEDAIDLGKMDRLLRYPSFENYVYQSGRGAMFRSTVFAAKLRGAADLHRKLPPLEFRDFLRDTAATIIQRFAHEDVRIAYRGSGEFSGFLAHRNGPLLQRLSEEVRIDILDSEGRDAAKLPASTRLIFAPGSSIWLPTRGELSRSIWTAVENVRAKAEPVVVQGSRWWPSRKPEPQADVTDEPKAPTRQELRAEFAQMLRDEVETDADRRVHKPSVFATPPARSKPEKTREPVDRLPRARVVPGVESAMDPVQPRKRKRQPERAQVTAQPAKRSAVADGLPQQHPAAAPRRPQTAVPARAATPDVRTPDAGTSRPGMTGRADEPAAKAPKEMSVEQALEAAVNKSRGQFVAKLADYHRTLAQVAKSDGDPAETDASIEQAMFVAHRIAGVGKTLGFPELGNVARETEATLAAYRQQRGSQELRKVSVSSADHLARLVKETCATYGAATV